MEAGNLVVRMLCFAAVGSPCLTSTGSDMIQKRLDPFGEAAEYGKFCELQVQLRAHILVPSNYLLAFV